MLRRCFIGDIKGTVWTRRALIVSSAILLISHTLNEGCELGLQARLCTQESKREHDCMNIAFSMAFPLLGFPLLGGSRDEVSRIPYKSSNMKQSSLLNPHDPPSNGAYKMASEPTTRGHQAHCAQRSRFGRCILTPAFFAIYRNGNNRYWWGDRGSINQREGLL